MALRRYKVTYEYEIVVNDITKESHAEKLKRFPNHEELKDDPDYWEHALKERRLLHALMSDPRIRERHIRYLASRCFEFTDSDDTGALLNVEDDEQEIIRAALALVHEDDARFWEEVEAEGIFSENAGEFYDAVKIELRDASVVEIADAEVESESVN